MTLLYNNMNKVYADTSKCRRLKPTLA